MFRWRGKLCAGVATLPKPAATGECGGKWVGRFMAQAYNVCTYPYILWLRSAVKQNAPNHHTLAFSMMCDNSADNVEWLAK